MSSIGVEKAANAARPVDQKGTPRGVPFICESTPRSMLTPPLTEIARPTRSPRPDLFRICKKKIPPLELRTHVWI